MKASGRLPELLRHLGQTLSPGDCGASTDADLLGRWIDWGDERAFEALVWRHGPMVLGVCRRVLGGVQDAEDAFQATFLVLVRKARSIAPRSRVGNWLYGVAHRTASNARAMSAERKRREMQAEQRSTPGPSPEEEELLARLDEELGRLPEKYRVPIVLCHLEGRAVQEAARELGLPQGTLASRLARGRALLARRLTGAVPAAAPAWLPAQLVSSVVNAAAVAASGGGGLAAVVSAKAVLLSERVMKAMLLAKLTAGAALLLLTATIAATAAALMPTSPGADDANVAGPPAPVAGGRAAGEGRARPANVRKVLEGLSWTLTGADEARGVVHVVDRAAAVQASGRPLPVLATSTGNLPTGLSIQDLPVRPGAAITLDGKPAKLGDLQPGMSVTLRVEEAGAVVAGIEARTPGPPLFRYRLKAIDPKARTVTVTLVEKNLDLEDLPVAAGAPVRFVEPGDVVRLSDARLEQLRPGMHLGLELAGDRDRGVVVQSVLASK
jgi:RNA polymerase sigma factor (sigma-70 family)